MIEPFDLVIGCRVLAAAVDLLRREPVDRVVDQRALAGARDARDAGHEPDRDLDVDAFQIVAASARDFERHLRIELAARLRQRDLAPARQVLARERGRVCADLLGCALGDDLAAMDTGAGAEVDDIVGRENCLAIVLDDEHRVAEIAQVDQRIEQALVVALVQPDRRLIEDVHDADEPRADLAREPDALRLAA